MKKKEPLIQPNLLSLTISPESKYTNTYWNPNYQSTLATQHAIPTIGFFLTLGFQSWCFIIFTNNCFLVLFFYRVDRVYAVTACTPK